MVDDDDDEDKGLTPEELKKLEEQLEKVEAEPVFKSLKSKDKVTKMYAPMNEKRFLGQFFMAIKIDVFEDINLFKKRLSNLCNRIHKLPSKDGKIYIPGEKELEIYNYRIVNGIPLSQSDFEKINMLQEEFNIENIINDD